jgi:hypothetical protein
MKDLKFVFGKCEFCNEKSELVHIKISIFGIYIRFYCNEHSRLHSAIRNDLKIML